MGERCATLQGPPTMKIINLYLRKGRPRKKNNKKNKKNFFFIYTPVFCVANYEKNG